MPRRAFGYSGHRLSDRPDEMDARRRRAQGLLTTAGGLLFGNDGSSNFCAFDAATGKILWHTWMPTLTTNGAQTFLLDGFQFVVVAAQDTVYAYTLNR